MKVIQCPHCRKHLATSSNITALCPFCGRSMTMKLMRVFYNSPDYKVIARAVQYLNSGGMVLS